MFKEQEEQIDVRSILFAELLIQPPPRTTVSGALIIFTSAAVFSLVAFTARVDFPAAGLCALLVLIAVLIREYQAVHSSLLCFALLIVPVLLPAFRTWPYNLLVPFLLYLSAVLLIHRLRESLSWMRPGRLRKDVVFLVIATSVLSGLALYTWYRLSRPDLSIHLKNVPHMPPWLFPLAGLGFSLGNAALEEAVFRGIFMQAFDSAVGPGSLSVVLQAWLFGALHYVTGFPNGPWGLALTFIYGVMLGAIRRRSRGMLAPWLAHVCADMVIFAILAGVVPAR